MSAVAKHGVHFRIRRVFTQKSLSILKSLSGRFGYFLFFLLGEGEGGVRGPGGGWGSVSYWNPRRGVSRRGKGRRAGRVSAANWGIAGGGGANIFFFRGLNVHQEAEVAKIGDLSQLVLLVLSWIAVRIQKSTPTGESAIFWFVGRTRRGSYSAKGRVSAFSAPSKRLQKSPPLLRTLLRTSVSIKPLTRRLLRTLLRSTSFKEPSKNPSKKRAVAWPPWCAP